MPNILPFLEWRLWQDCLCDGLVWMKTQWDSSVMSYLLTVQASTSSSSSPTIKVALPSMIIYVSSGGRVKWLEVSQMPAATSRAPIQQLWALFAQFGLPTIAMDNGPCFFLVKSLQSSLGIVVLSTCTRPLIIQPSSPICHNSILVKLKDSTTGLCRIQVTAPLAEDCLGKDICMCTLKPVNQLHLCPAPQQGVGHWYV